MLHRTIVAFSVVAFQASAQECGLGDFVCDGQAWQYGGNNPSPTFQNRHKVEALEAGWWQVEVLAGGDPPGFEEYQYCTQSPKADLPARLTISAGSDLICVAGARTDMKDPTVRVTWHYEDCNTFVKVVQTATATSTNENLTQTADEVARITCRRSETLATARSLREQTPVLPKEAPPVRVRAQEACPEPASYTCTGEMYERPDGDTGFGNGHFVTITDRVNTFAYTGDSGWYSTLVGDSGSFSEKQTCARTPDADGKSFTAPSTFWCSTESRSDQDEPAVSTYLHHHDCNLFIKVVTVGPALKTETQEATKPQIAMLRCVRPEAVTAEELPPSPVRNQAADEVCEVGEFTCEGEERNSTTMSERDSYIETLASTAEGWWTLTGDVGTSMCLMSAESTTRNSIMSGADMMCVQHDVARPVYVHAHFSDCNSYQKVLVRGASQAGDPMARVQCVRKAPPPPPPTTTTPNKVGLTSLSFLALAVSLVTVAADF